MTLPAIVVTGGSGFVGRHLLDELKNKYRIFAIARRSQRECGAPQHPNIAWMRVDIGDREELSRIFREIETAGGAKFLFHLAAYYDFAGSANPEYQRTNIDGTRNVLEFSRKLGLSRLFFFSSVAACSFPAKGTALTETSPPDGDHIYAWSKRVGEAMVNEYGDTCPTCIVRFGAIYSDWCEYPPLYMFLKTWLGNAWNSRILGGKGESAIPYVHIREIIGFLQKLIDCQASLGKSALLIASTSGCTSHRQLFSEATRSYCGIKSEPICVPALLAGWGIIAMNLWGKLNGNPPFEKPWMRRYIDLKLAVDNSRTCSRLSWSPDPRYQIDKRLPFLIERMKSDPIGWHTRNLAVIRRMAFRPELPIYLNLSRAEDEIIASAIRRIQSLTTYRQFPYFNSLENSELLWLVRLTFRLLLTSIQSGNRLLILNYLQVTGSNFFKSGCSATELSLLFQTLHDLAKTSLQDVAELKGYQQQVFDSVTMPIELAKDEIIELNRSFQQGEVLHFKETADQIDASADPRSLLEETIWKCLVQRK